MNDTQIFDYQNPTGSRILSYVILVLTLGITLAVRSILDNAILTILSFVGSLILLSLVGVFVNRALFVHEAEYSLTPAKLTIRAGKQTIVLTPEEINGISCDPIYEKQSKGTDTVKCWHLVLRTVQKKYEFYSVNVLEKDDDNQASIHQFKALGKELKHWSGMI